MKKKIIRGTLLGTLAFIFAFIIHNLKPFRHLEWKSWDVRLQLFSSPAHASQDIVIFLVDQYSLDLYEKEQSFSWPWPREIYAAIIRYLQAGKAKACFFDIFMTEGSSFGIEDDQKFASAMSKAGNVFLPIFLSKEEKESDEASVQLLKRFSLNFKYTLLQPDFSFKSVTTPLPSLLSSARGVGNVQLFPDGDGIYRRLPLVFSFRDIILPSVPVALASFVKGEERIQTIPVDHSGQMIVRYYGPTGTYKTYSMAAIINSWALMEQGKAPQIPPQEFYGKTVLVGLSAAGLYDLKTSPLSAVIPGVEIQAAALDTILQQDFIRICPKSLLLGLAFIFALLTGIGVSILKKIWKIILFSVFCLFFPLAIVCLAFASGYWLEFVFPEFGVLTSLLSASLLNYTIEGKQRRFIKSVFRYYLSPEVIERIIENPVLLRLGGEQREITSFFSDLAGFTSISEKLTPKELVRLLNAYLSEMTDIILASGGTLDKYEGDAIIAFWNAPLDQPDHALRACQAVLSCQKRLKELKQDFQKSFGHEISMRIGLNSGLAVVGNLGSSQRFDYTAIGDTVNLAARLESACKQYKLPNLIGESTYEKVRDDIVVREVDILRVMGKERPVRIFELIEEKGKVISAELARIETFHRALEAYRLQNWERAISLFEKLGADSLAQTYLARCLSLRLMPPPKDWDTVYELKAK